MANEHGKLLSWKFFSRFSITTPATRWELAATVANRNWFNSSLAQRACGWQCPLNGEGKGGRLQLPPLHTTSAHPPHDWLSHDSSWNRYLNPFVRGSCWVSAAARSGWKADDALHLPGIIWDRLACRLAAVNHHQYSINYLMFDLCFTLRLFTIVSLLSPPFLAALLSLFAVFFADFVCSCHDFLFWLRGAISVCLIRFGCVRALHWFGLCNSPSVLCKLL